MNKNIWETLWDYNPNALLVINENYEIQIINTAFVNYFDLNNTDIIGRKVTDFFPDIDDFVKILLGETNLISQTKVRGKLGLTFSETTFRVEDKNLVAKIFHNVKPENKEFESLKKKITDDVHMIVEKQMVSVQEIASLLGKTTAETKASVNKLLHILKDER